MVKTMIGSAALAFALGFGANRAAADSFSVSVHTPTVSVGYSNVGGHHHSGYVAAPAPVVVSRPVVVHRPVVIHERHVCRYEWRPVTHVRYDRWGCRYYETTYVQVRLCDDYHRHYDGGGHYSKYDRHDHKHGRYDYKYDRDDNRHRRHDRHDDDDDRGHRGRR